MTRTASKLEAVPPMPTLAEEYVPEMVQFHIGVTIGGSVLSSASIYKTHSQSEPAKLKLLPMGVLIAYKNERMIVSYNNCIRIKLKV